MVKLAELNNEERKKREKTAQDFSRRIHEFKEKKISALTEEQKTFLENGAYYTDEPKFALAKKLMTGLKEGTYKRPSDFFRAECSWLFDGIIYECFRDSFLYQADNCIKYPYTQGWMRRPFRSADYGSYASKISVLISQYKCMQVNRNLADIINGSVSEEEKAFLEEYPRTITEYDIAYEIDMGNEAVINRAKNAVESGSGADISYELLRGIFKSGNTELHDLAGKLLLAARLQEGLRQAICETCDEGVFSAFRTIIGVIKDNDLIRFSSVKRAVGTWTGLLAAESKDLERISGKTMELIVGCLDSTDFRRECLESDDAMKIYLGLWSISCTCVESGIDSIYGYIGSGTDQQLLASAFFSKELYDNSLKHDIAKRLILEYPDRYDLMAISVPCLLIYRYSAAGYDPDADLAAHFAGREEAERVYGILLEMYNEIPKKSLEFSPCVFPWNSESLTKSDLVRRLARIAAMLRDNDKIDEMCVKLSDIDCSGYGTRSFELKILLSNPQTDIQLRALVAECADRESYTRGSAFEIVEKIELRSEHYRQLEDMLKYKAADIRSKVINVLFKMDDEALFECTDRLICGKKEEKRTAGLDIIMQLSKNPERRALYERCVPLTEKITGPTSKEEILIRQIKSVDQSDSGEDNGYGLYTEEDHYTPEWDDKFISECRELFMKYFPGSEICGTASKASEADYVMLLKKLDDLIDENKNYEFTDRYGEKVLFGSSGSWEEKLPDGSMDTVLKEVWESFYVNEIKSPEMLVRMRIGIAEKDERFADMYCRIHGNEFRERYTPVYDNRLDMIVNHLIAEHADKNELFMLACAVGAYICEYPDTSELFAVYPSMSYYKYTNYYVVDHKVIKTQDNVELITRKLRLLNYLTCPADENIKTYFAVKMKLAEKFGYFDIINDNELKNQRGYGHNVSTYDCPLPALFIRAAYYGVISEGYMFKYFLNYVADRSKVISAASGIVMEYREHEGKLVSRRRGYWYRKGEAMALLLCQSKPEITDENKPIIEYAVVVYEKLAEVILGKELSRGDSPSEFTDCISGFQRIYGAERFVRILAAMGKDTIDRSSWHIGNNADRKASFSHLLGVCVPDSDDDAEKLRRLLKETDVTEKRVVEAALFAPQWINIVQDYLGWEGFRSACYYFMAHMNELLDDVKTAVIAKYTPISVSDLASGAFDIDWFKEAYSAVGEKRFDIIYNAAKYISDGSKHSRARKYADAVMGKLDKESAVNNIKEKRNKDTLMAYTLIPLDGEDDIFERYLLLQEFKKQSRQFGAQRKASEGKAVEIAMQNLAKNAGYEDVTRLTLRMETKLFDDIRELTEFKELGEISIRLVIGEDGKASVECVKSGKALKSVPAKYKKDETVIRLTEVKKQLTEQYRRTRIMLEQSMEDRVAFKAYELDALSGNPVVYPLIKDLVYLSGEKLGFLKGMELISADGGRKALKKESELIIAHPFDLYKNGSWREYQKILFDGRIVQPFKQVFRELYVKTDEEAEMFNSRRYSGNQIQPKQTAACLKSRRWVADIEDGLQKIYYKENVIARIYALADWFSPADIEAPTLEWVEFTDRKTGSPIKINEIPDIIFSEVMRDVDLAVSVAHAGGVDPETSHSTIEMRRAICEFTMPLFRLDNVTFEKSHAFIKGERADYSIHLGSGVIHIQGGPMINVLPVHSQHRGKLFLPFADEDPKTAQIISEILLFAEDKKIKDPFILQQIK